MAILPIITAFIMTFSAESKIGEYCIEYGEYTNIVPPQKGSIEGEISGIAIEIWKCDDEILGLFYEYCGLPADPPTGKLDSIKYDPSTGNLSFRVKISLGGNYDPATKNVIDSRDRYSFSGKLKIHKSINGILEHSEDNSTRSYPNSVQLKYEAKKSPYEKTKKKIIKTDLEKSINEILDRLGPKW